MVMVAIILHKVFKLSVLRGSHIKTTYTHTCKSMLESINLHVFSLVRHICIDMYICIWEKWSSASLYYKVNTLNYIFILYVHTYVCKRMPKASEVFHSVLVKNVHKVQNVFQKYWTNCNFSPCLLTVRASAT